jgi:hypothetical protein
MPTSAPAERQTRVVVHPIVQRGRRRLLDDRLRERDRQRRGLGRDVQAGARLGDRAAEQDRERAALRAFPLELFEERRAVHVEEPRGLLLVAA